MRILGDTAAAFEYLYSAKMAEAGPSLGDFFKSKGKKKIKASNLNNNTATTKTEETKKKTKDKEDDVWEEEQVVAQTMKVEVAGKLLREEEKKDDEDAAAPAWKVSKDQKEGASINDRKFPSLAKSVGNINIDDGSEAKVNIATSKNLFAALEGEDQDDEENSNKRPKQITPAMVSKKKGEREKVAVQREVDKYTTKKDSKKKAKAAPGEDDDEDEEDEEEEDNAPEDEPEEKGKKKKPSEKKDERKDDKKVKKSAVEEAENELEEDLQIQPDDQAAKEKYKGRKKLPRQELPREELEEQKENKKVNVNQVGKKKKFAVVEEVEKKLAYAD